QAALPRTAASLLLATVFSSSKKVLHASCAYGKTRPRSAHFLFALQSGCATSLAFQVGSCQKLAASDARRQDGVQISLTGFLSESDQFDWNSWVPQKPSLLVADYGATRASHLQRVVETLSTLNESSCPPVRLLSARKGGLGMVGRVRGVWWDSSICSRY